jgi:hypothetical protein
MIINTFGAPLGGTTRGDHHGLDWAAFRSISPPNFDGGDGKYFPSIVVVDEGEPGTPVVCRALLKPAATVMSVANAAKTVSRLRVLIGSVSVVISNYVIWGFQVISVVLSA